MADPDILIVDDDVHSVHTLGHILQPVGSVRFALSGAEALTLVQQATPDLILLDCHMPGMSGFEVCARIRSDARLASVPVIFVTSDAQDASQVAGLDLGAADYIHKPINAALLLARVRAQLRIKQRADDLQHQSVTDSVTGVANRRCFDDLIRTQWADAMRQGRSCVLMLIDIDNFASFIDRYGVWAGDDRLRAVAQAVQDAVAPAGGAVARFRGATYAVLLPDAATPDALQIAEAIVQHVGALPLPDGIDAQVDRASVSIGVASTEAMQAFAPTAEGADAATGAAPEVTQLIDAADQALYAARSRNTAATPAAQVSHVELRVTWSEA